VSRQAEVIGKTNRIQVVAGILQNDRGEFLISDRRRAHSMYDCWEFPGGKVKVGESADVALCRELHEELGVTAVDYAPFAKIEHDYSDLSIAIEFFVVRAWQESPLGMEGQEIRWVNKLNLGEETMLAADAPIVARVLQEL
jgi:8-oxo-dGTP diphosphatase